MTASPSTSLPDTSAFSPDLVPSWDHEADVVVVGHGGAGASAAIEAGAAVLNDCRVERLVQDPSTKRVVGVVARQDGKTVHVRARKAVILAAGGFIMNKEMLAEHAPDLLDCNWEAASPADDGLGIRIGQGAGADTVNMGEGLVVNAIYPPGSHCKGILVNAQGQRFVNEDAYVGRTSDAMLARAAGTCWLILDDEIHGPTQAFHKVAAVEDTIADLESALRIPDGQLVHTVDTYNRFAAQGEDPLFHKAPKYLRPLGEGPYGALDCTTGNSIYAGFTFGGLATRATGEVLDPTGRPIPGLYAAGRVAAGLPLEGRTYASGLSIGDATFFGRVAGRNAANAALPHPTAGG